jgi:outer membrane immunogenic protein
MPALMPGSPDLFRIWRFASLGAGKTGAPVKLLKPVLSGTVLSALAATPAFSADIPVKAPVTKAPAAVALFNWTGFYVGANVGGAWGKNSLDESSGIWWVTRSDLDPSSVIGGLQAGQNWQVNNVVYGVEADISLLSAKDRTNFPGVASHESELTALGTVRGRVGIASDRTLFFITGGGAYGRVKNEAIDPASFAGATSAGRDSSAWGWVAGGGIEHAFANNWSARVEFLHTRFASDTVTVPGTAYVFRFKDSVSVARAGINYRF